ncbi:MAG: universal stress protein [Myxococcales bacterium]|nr:MAG: universal stress protein [Myxococcales bacterium]
MTDASDDSTRGGRGHGRHPIHRITVALDPSDPNLGTLHAAAEIAARTGAELAGVFVEDVDLLRLAALPFAQEFTPYARSGRDIDTSAMERTLRGQATVLRRALAAAAERRKIRWSFQVSRGHVAGEILTASENADLVIVGRSRRLGARAPRVGSTARIVVHESKRTVLVLAGGADVGRPVLVLYDGTPSSERALVTAAAIAHEDHKNLVVAISSADDRATERLSEAALSILGSLGIHARVAALPGPEVTQLLTALERERCRTLVVGIGSIVSHGVTPAELIEHSCCPVVIVR